LNKLRQQRKTLNNNYRFITDNLRNNVYNPEKEAYMPILNEMDQRVEETGAHLSERLVAARQLGDVLRVNAQTVLKQLASEARNRSGDAISAESDSHGRVAEANENEVDEELYQTSI
jgi:hypothetical protein